MYHTWHNCAWSQKETFAEVWKKQFLRQNFMKPQLFALLKGEEFSFVGRHKPILVTILNVVSELQLFECSLFY